MDVTRRNLVYPLDDKLSISVSNMNSNYLLQALNGDGRIRDKELVSNCLVGIDE